MRATYSLITVLLGGVMLVGPNAQAADVVCPPNLKPGEIIDGNVIVVDQCELTRTTVKGWLILQEKADLIARQTTVLGSTETDGAQRIQLIVTDVIGDVRLSGVQGPTSKIINSDIGGTVDIKANQSRFVLRENTVDSDLEVNMNTDRVVIRDNVIGGNLQCRDNNPPPIGGGNTVGGNKGGQCEEL